MHSGQHIKVANSQRKLDITGLEVGQEITLTPIGGQVGTSINLPIEALDDDTIVAGDAAFKTYMGSLVSYKGKLHDLSLPQPIAA